MIIKDTSKSFIIICSYLSNENLLLFFLFLIQEARENTTEVSASSPEEGEIPLLVVEAHVLELSQLDFELSWSFDLLFFNGLGLRLRSHFVVFIVDDDSFLFLLLRLLLGDLLLLLLRSLQ